MQGGQQQANKIVAETHYNLISVFSPGIYKHQLTCNRIPGRTPTEPHSQEGKTATTTTSLPVWSGMPPVYKYKSQSFMTTKVYSSLKHTGAVGRMQLCPSLRDCPIPTGDGVFSSRKKTEKCSKYYTGS